MFQRIRFFFPVLGASMLLFLACGGGGGGSTSTPPVASKLHYTNHPSATPSDWRIEVEAGQDTGQLVLKLMGPAGLQAKGASCFLACDGVVTTWVGVTPGTAFNLGSGPQIVRAKTGSSANEYQMGIYQKTGTATLGTAPVALITLGLKSGAAPGSGSLTVSKAGVYLDAAGDIKALPTILVGTISAAQ